MTTYFVSRHAGAIEWARAEGLPIDVFLAHLDGARVAPGDTVIGSLPVHLAAQVCQAGACYRHLTLTVRPEQRGQELSLQDLRDAGLCLQGYRVQPAESSVP